MILRPFLLAAVGILLSGAAPLRAQPALPATRGIVATPVVTAIPPGRVRGSRDTAGPRQTLLYRLDTQTIPRAMLPWVRRGVEEWAAVYDSLEVGPKIVIKEQPYTAEPDVAGAAPGCWIGWGSAFPAGPGASDNRAETHFDETGPDGQIVRSSIVVDSSLVALYQWEYFLFVGDQPAGLHFPFPDSLTGMLVQFIVAHEVGHSLGYDHAFREGAIYPTDSLRSTAFLERHHGHSGSIMGYATLNYVAQPEDHVPLTDLVMHVGLYDRWEAYWRYTPGAQRPAGDRLRAIRDTAPYLRALVHFAGDPNDQLRAIGTEPLQSTEYAFRNLARALPRVDSQRVADPSLPAALRTLVMNRWPLWLGHVVAVVGGSRLVGPLALEPAATSVAPIDSATQAAALRFVLAHLFSAKNPILRHVIGPGMPDSALVLFDTVTPGWSAQAWREAQASVFHQLFGQLEQVEAQSKTTHLFPVMCAELTALAGNLERAVAATHSPEARTHGEELLRSLTSLTDPTFGTCGPERLQDTPARAP